MVVQLWTKIELQISCITRELALAEGRRAAAILDANRHEQHKVLDVELQGNQIAGECWQFKHATICMLDEADIGYEVGSIFRVDIHYFDYRADVRMLGRYDCIVLASC